MKVLLVDDDTAALEIRRLVLERHGFEVTIASNSGSALAAFHNQQPDVVVLDLRVPAIDDGLALIRAFHESKIIILCGNRADLDGREEARLVHSILGKPVRSEELIKQITG